MKQLRVTNIQRGCVYDGPGVRTTVFLKGCPLRCPWCCNPETILFDQQWYIDDEKCLIFKDQVSVFCKTCERCGGTRPLTDCSFGVVEPTSIDYEIKPLVDLLIKDKSLFDETQGGITFSGGEPLLQAESLEPVLCELKNKSFSIAIETTLVAPAEKVKLVIPYIDCWIIDLKLQPQMYLNDVVYLERICKMTHIIPREKTTFRMVFVNEVLDNKDKILLLYNEIGLKRIEILCCHNLGQKKYQKLNMPNKNYVADKTKADIYVDFLNGRGIEAKLLFA